MAAVIDAIPVDVVSEPVAVEVAVAEDEDEDLVIVRLLVITGTSVDALLSEIRLSELKGTEAAEDKDDEAVEVCSPVEVDSVVEALAVEVIGAVEVAAVVGTPSTPPTNWNSGL